MKADSQTLVGPGWQLRLFLTHGSSSVLSRRLGPARSHLALFEMITFHASAWGRGGAHEEPQDLSPRFRILASPLGTGQVPQECRPSPGAGEEGRPASLWARVAGGTPSSGRARVIWALKDGLVLVCRQGRRNSPKGDKGRGLRRLEPRVYGGGLWAGSGPAFRMERQSCSLQQLHFRIHLRVMGTGDRLLAPWGHFSLFCFDVNASRLLSF